MKELKVIYEDNHIIVIEKPINILSQRDNTNDFDVNEILEIIKENIRKSK